MKSFYSDKIFLSNLESEKIYSHIKDLPIIDYHCHLDEKKIMNDDGFKDIGELWLSGDHYKWRAMRLCGIPEKYITGDASYYEKFLKYAEIVPNLAGNPLYYWTHFELNKIFGIKEPLNKDTAKDIYDRANKKLEKLKVSDLFALYKVEYVATTNDPTDDLTGYGKIENVTIAPTFRPDKIYSFDDKYINVLGKTVNININNLDDFLEVLRNRLDYFVANGCKISDHGFEKFPENYASYEEAKLLFVQRHKLTPKEKDMLFGFILVWLSKEYQKRNIIMQIHFSVIRNNNIQMFKYCGVDSGFDLIGECQNVKNLIKFFNQQSEETRPMTILYSLNDVNLTQIAAVTGAFKNVRMGAAWWFNDTVNGIRRNLSIISEYSVLGTNLGMLTDSRAFSSYGRFDFFRRILADYLGNLVLLGEYDETAAYEVAEKICYSNIKELIYK